MTPLSEMYRHQNRCLSKLEVPHYDLLYSKHAPNTGSLLPERPKNDISDANTVRVIGTFVGTLDLDILGVHVGKQ